MENEQRQRFGEFTGQLKTLNKIIDELKQKIERFQKIQSQYSDAAIADIRNILQLGLGELDEKISCLKDSQKAIDTLTSKVILQKSKIVDRNKKKQVVEQYDTLLINHIDGHSATVLSNLNSHFLEIIVKPECGAGKDYRSVRSAI